MSVPHHCNFPPRRSKKQWSGMIRIIPLTKNPCIGQSKPLLFIGSLLKTVPIPPETWRPPLNPAATTLIEQHGYTRPIGSPFWTRWCVASGFGPSSDIISIYLIDRQLVAFRIRNVCVDPASGIWSHVRVFTEGMASRTAMQHFFDHKFSLQISVLN